MNNMELCHKLVELGILEVRDNRHLFEKKGHAPYYFTFPGAGYHVASYCVNDWRVAGACLERMPSHIIGANCHLHGWDWLKDPCGIIKAFVEAQND